MTDAAALDQAVRENIVAIRRVIAQWPTVKTADWYDGIGFLPEYTVALIRVSYRRIAAKRANADGNHRVNDACRGFCSGVGLSPADEKDAEIVVETGAAVGRDSEEAPGPVR